MTSRSMHDIDEDVDNFQSCDEKPIENSLNSTSTSTPANDVSSSPTVTSTTTTPDNESKMISPEADSEPPTSSAVLLQGFQQGIGTLISYTGNPATTLAQIQDMGSDAMEIGGVFLDVNSTVTDKITNVFVKTLLKGKSVQKR